MQGNVHPRRNICLNLLVLALALFFSGCGGDVKMEEQISGKWRSEGANGSVEIQLTQAPQQIIIDGRTYPVTVKGADSLSKTVEVAVNTGNGSSDVWFLQQKWNDNGNEFKLVLRRGDNAETLIPVARS